MSSAPSDMPDQEGSAPTADSPGRVALVVLGMHRSGSSALTRVLSLLGAELPADLMPAESDNNEAGFWESASLSDLDERLLASLGSGWDDVLEFPSRWPDPSATETLMDEGVRLLRRQFGRCPLFAIKDPRISRLVPLWLSMLGRDGAEPRFAHTIRHPLEVADSLAARDSFPEGKSVLLWLRYVLDGERDSRGYSRAFLPYDRLLDDWREAVAQLKSTLDLRLESPGRAIEEEIERFLSPALRHHRRSAGELGSGFAVDRLAATAYQALMAAAAGEGSALTGTMDGIRAELETLERAYRPALVAERERMVRDRTARSAAERRAAASEDQAQALSQEVRRIEAEVARAERKLSITEQKLNVTAQKLNAVLGSHSWRLTTPLRSVARSMRRKERR